MATASLFITVCNNDSPSEKKSGFVSVKARNFEPQEIFETFLASPTASLDELCSISKNEQKRIRKSNISPQLSIFFIFLEDVF
jgi:hypothetical protein